SSTASATATSSGIERQQTSYALPIEHIISIACQCLDALGYAHKRGVIHRDVKPNNILLVNKGALHQAKMTDFGIAKLMSGSESANGYALTRAGIGLGTPEYMAPEQIDPQRFGGIDHRADLYSLGLVIFEMISGVNPFGSRTTSEFQILEQKVKGEIPSIKSYCSCVDFRLEKILTKALGSEPSARFHNASEFKQSLSELKSADSVCFADARTKAIHVWDRQNKKRFHGPLFRIFVKSRILPKRTPGTVLNSFGLRNVLRRLKVILAFCVSTLFRWGQNRLLYFILGLFLVSAVIGLWYFGFGRQKPLLLPSTVESPQDKDPFTVTDKWSEKGRLGETSVSRSGRSNDPFIVNRTASPAKALEDDFWENPTDNLSNRGRGGEKPSSSHISKGNRKEWSPRTGGGKKPSVVIDRGSVLRQRNN
ncbi:MAG: serine/threonine protein kinase, partial [Deltaproteobacteria bacterium]|nr:serine/threonine protein kinase [Deltaproteobacteria bacterium]